MTRRGITSNMRARIFLDAQGVCHICGIRIQAETGEPWDVEHRKPLWLGGTDDEANMAPAHIHCHRLKNAGEAPERAKSDRIRNRHLGIRQDRHIRAWRKFSGEIVRKPARREP
jgi:5-methylcytosine-specific restriction protein A